MKWNTVSKSTTTGEASDWLKQQVEEQRRFVQPSEAAAAAIQEGERGGGPRRTTEHRRPEIGGYPGSERREPRPSRSRKQTQFLQLSRLQAQGGALDTLPAIASNPFHPGSKGQLADMQQQLAQASEQLGESSSRHHQVADGGRECRAEASERDLEGRRGHSE